MHDCSTILLLLHTSSIFKTLISIRLLSKEISEETQAAIFIHQDKFNICRAKDELKQAQQEWDFVEDLPSEEQNVSSKFVTYEEIWEYFKKEDMKAYLKNIKPVCNRKGFSFILHYLCGPVKMHQDLRAERNLIFAIAQCPLDCKLSFHANTLQTIYNKLTGVPGYCRIYGNHWEEVGFQGNDPSTDTRGVGFFGILQLLYFILNPSTSKLAMDIYRLSQDEVQNFPFCVMSINMTRIAIEALREEILNKICNQRGEVISVINEFYAGTFLYLYNKWKGEYKTIMDSGFVLKGYYALCNS
ncbi:ELMO domain-containing protein 3-like isoform X1 [Centruroides sculpturatus]|uniref:ELMO domain-containing protein 3-like isoform X1 n=1 Tax=Centruroides sculpturatus TaxID=218467 RepID=UPI000C6DDC24|nr:ELMO domain-containing protein 3-like isoform X1 [Centruroides sculpturatus]